MFVMLAFVYAPFCYTPIKEVISVDVNFLQSLDFLLQKAYKHYPTKKWNIIFKLDDEIYTAKFIKKTSSEDVVYNHLNSDDNQQHIALMSEESYSAFQTNNPLTGEISPIQRLVNYLDAKNSFDVYRLLKEYVNIFEVNPSKLDNFAFDIKNLKTGECFPFIEINESSKIQFVTLATDEDLQTLTHALK